MLIKAMTVTLSLILVANILAFYPVTAPPPMSTPDDYNNHDNAIESFSNSYSSGSSFYGQRFLVTLISHIFEMLNLKQVVTDIKESRATEATCYACKFGIALVQHFIEFGKGKEEMAKLATTVCITLKIEDRTVCKGIINTYKDEFVEVVSQLAFSPTEICGTILGDSCAEVYNPLHNWTVPLTPLPKPAVPNPPTVPTSNVPTLKILQISDTHVDLQYLAGGEVNCGEPLCCRKPVSSFRGHKKDHKMAGYWGEYDNCDIPLRTLQAMLKDIKQNHVDIDYVIWTGDIPPHDVWNQTRNGQVALLKQISTLINRYLGDIPIYPALGNHESVPVNSFPPPSIKGSYSISWLYDALTEVWSQWLPQDTIKTIAKGGYYSVYVKPGLKLISLNMNYCNNLNLWLLLNSTDPADELTWLINELQTSELLGEKVHIIGHIPPGSNDCLQVWSRNYYRIINRFESTIAAQFFGHTHQDEFVLFYDEEDNTGPFSSFRPTSIGYIGPSVTTFGGVNPSYRIYSMATNETNWPFTIVDHATYYLNLTEANLNPNQVTEWNYSYSPLDSYDLVNLTPSSWNQFVISMASNDTLFKTFYDNYFVVSDSHNQCTEKACRFELLCRLISGHSKDTKICDQFMDQYGSM
ncbi:sphingomyelin phosphodiesterase [Tetranychus urticae]|uniref:Sphingomyelin phosphodiesterase n=1 Tax=Tetranychus urticae TaxID=32264 RepID=T1KY18_TETUR|nr:sphingomyelin phosphodiesterase [Tetranychus urticae]